MGPVRARTTTTIRTTTTMITLRTATTAIPARTADRDEDG
jgi:hypothetical protein